MNKRILVIFIAVLFALTLLSCSNQNNKDDKDSSAASSNITKASISEITYQTSEKNSKNSDFKNNNSTAAYVFAFEIKDKYSSRSEIKMERQALENAYCNHAEENENISSEQKQKNLEIYYDIDHKLEKMYQEMTFNKEEIQSSKKAEFDSEVSAWESEVFMMSSYLNDYGPENGTDPTYYQYVYEYARKTYKQALAIKEEYESGKITLEQALKKVKKLKYEF